MPDCCSYGHAGSIGYASIVVRIVDRQLVWYEITVIVGARPIGMPDRQPGMYGGVGRVGSVVRRIVVCMCMRGYRHAVILPSGLTANGG